MDVLLHRAPPLQRPDDGQHQEDPDHAREQPAGGGVAVLQVVGHSHGKHDRLDAALEQPLLRHPEQVDDPLHGHLPRATHSR